VDAAARLVIQGKQRRAAGKLLVSNFGKMRISYKESGGRNAKDTKGGRGSGKEVWRE